GCSGGVEEEFRPSRPIENWSNEDWATVLAMVVTPEGFVRHDLLQKNQDGVRDTLFRYAAAIEAASPLNRPELFPTEKHRLAYYCNAYNALCLYRVVKRNFPENVKTSGIFVLDLVSVGGRRMNLDFLERTYLRPYDPRIHFAINCMSTSCPPLRKEPFEADRLEEQLAEQGRIFLSDPRGAVRRGDGVVISEIFRFFSDDFTEAFARKTGRQPSGILEAIEEFSAPDSPIRGARTVEFQKYDWSLNRPR
ncbi:MAG: DUF547 domain-containing protein, partial [Phycisphaerae bacterium]|nr:DUF547 domain-containing protein [Phycisphaerae bacterium]MDW8263441.1 DUF547 domain-containing protein [Phycisphaerales bacterium]